MGQNKKWYVVGAAMGAFLLYMFVGPRLKGSAPPLNLGGGAQVPPAPIPAEQGGVSPSAEPFSAGSQTAYGPYPYYPGDQGFLGHFSPGLKLGTGKLLKNNIRGYRTRAYRGGGRAYNTRLIVT